MAKSTHGETYHQVHVDGHHFKTTAAGKVYTDEPSRTGKYTRFRSADNRTEQRYPKAVDVDRDALSAAIDAIEKSLPRPAPSWLLSMLDGESCRVWADHHFKVSTATTEESPTSIEDRLRQARAERELQRLREMRTLVEASEGNLAQRVIADLVGRSQSDVSRMLKAARARHDVAGQSVREIILSYVVREITRGELLGRLTGLQHGRVEGPDLSDGYRHGTFDDVKVAWLDGLIDDDLYEEIHRANPQPTDHARHRAAAEQ